MPRTVKLRWHRFASFIAARNAFRADSCVYLQATSRGQPLRIGKASVGLEGRYRGGTGYALDAAAHGSRNQWFVAAVPKALCEAVERELIWVNRSKLRYNNQGVTYEPPSRVRLQHSGSKPRISIRSPSLRESIIESKIVFTTTSVSFFEICGVRFATSSIRPLFVILLSGS